MNDQEVKQYEEKIQGKALELFSKELEDNREFYNRYFKEEIKKYRQTWDLSPSQWKFGERIVSNKIQNMIVDKLYMEDKLPKGDDEALIMVMLENSRGYANIILGEIGVWNL